MVLFFICYFVFFNLSNLFGTPFKVGKRRAHLAQFKFSDGHGRSSCRCFWLVSLRCFNGRLCGIGRCLRLVGVGRCRCGARCHSGAHHRFLPTDHLSSRFRLGSGKFSEQGFQSLGATPRGRFVFGLRYLRHLYQRKFRQ